MGSGAEAYWDEQETIDRCSIARRHCLCDRLCRHCRRRCDQDCPSQLRRVARQAGAARLSQGASSASPDSLCGRSQLASPYPFRVRLQGRIGRRRRRPRRLLYRRLGRRRQRPARRGRQRFGRPAASFRTWNVLQFSGLARFARFGVRRLVGSNLRRCVVDPELPFLWFADLPIRARPAVSSYERAFGPASARSNAHGSFPSEPGPRSDAAWAHSGRARALDLAALRSRHCSRPRAEAPTRWKSDSGPVIGRAMTKNALAVACVTPRLIGSAARIGCRRCSRAG